MSKSEVGAKRRPGGDAPGAIDQIAELTRHRDRDQLDATLAGAMAELLRPVEVAVYRIIGDDDDPRWSSRATLTREDKVPRADPPWVDVDSLPRLGEDPERAQVLAEGHCLAVAGAPHRSLFPVATDLDVVGVLEIHTDEPLGADQQRLVSSILRVYRNFEALIDYSERDTLTGLLNRKTFDESFLKLATAGAPAASAPALSAGSERRADASAAGFWLGVIDVDHFKRVNDRFGHLIGDEVLLLLARLMRRSFRHGDRLYRFGGEEFVALVRCADASGAALAFERLRGATERQPFPQVGHITVSVGFTQVRLGDSPSAAFERADQAVYHAKEHGRNQVVNHADLVERGELDARTKVGDIELF